MAGGRTVTVYHGIVKGQVVELTDPVDLPDGTEVEVRVLTPSEPVSASSSEMDERARAKRRLCDTCLRSA